MGGGGGLGRHKKSFGFLNKVLPLFLPVWYGGQSAISDCSCSRYCKYKKGRNSFLNSLIFLFRGYKVQPQNVFPSCLEFPSLPLWTFALSPHKAFGGMERPGLERKKKIPFVFFTASRAEKLFSLG